MWHKKENSLASYHLRLKVSSWYHFDIVTHRLFSYPWPDAVSRQGNRWKTNKYEFHPRKEVWSIFIMNLKMKVTCFFCGSQLSFLKKLTASDLLSDALRYQDLWSLRGWGIVLRHPSILSANSIWRSSCWPFLLWNEKGSCCIVSHSVLLSFASVMKCSGGHKRANSDECSQGLKHLSSEVSFSVIFELNILIYCH